MSSFTVTDGQDPFLHISLERGESVFAESGAMVMMDGTLDLIGNVQGGLLVRIQPPGIDSPNARPPRRFGRGVSSMVT